MDAETVQAKMMAQVDQARHSALATAYKWSFEIVGLIVYVGVIHRRRPDNSFLLRVTFDDFPRRAPSYVFVDPGTRESNGKGWPPGMMHSDNPPKICTPGTREFHELIHQNDAQYAWDADRYTVLSTLQRVHALMESGVGG